MAESSDSSNKEQKIHHQRKMVETLSSVVRRNIDDWYHLSHNMWCCSEHQAKFMGPFSPNSEWRTASGVGTDTICDFPFGCSNCECEPDGADESTRSYGFPRISSLGCRQIHSGFCLRLVGYVMHVLEAIDLKHPEEAENSGTY